MMIGQSGPIELLLKNKLPIGSQFISVDIIDTQKIENDNGSATLLTLGDSKQTYAALIQQGDVSIGKINIQEWHADDNMIHILKFQIPSLQSFQYQSQGPQNSFIDYGLLNNTFEKGFNQYQSYNTTFQNQSFENLDHQQNMHSQRQQQPTNLKYEYESFQQENKKQIDTFQNFRNLQFQNQFQNQQNDQQSHQQQQLVTIEGIIKMKTNLKLCKNGQDKYFSIRIQTGFNNLTKIQFFYPFSLEFNNTLILGKSYRFINFGEGIFNGFHYLKAINQSSIATIKQIKFQQVVQQEFLGKIINVEPQKKVQKLTILKDGQQVKLKIIDQDDMSNKINQNCIFQNFIEGMKDGIVKYKSAPKMKINAINIIEQQPIQNNILNMSQNDYVNNKIQWSSIEYIKNVNSLGNTLVNLIAICQYEQDYQTNKDGKQKKDFYLIDQTGSILLQYWPQQNQNNLIADGQIVGLLNLKVSRGQNDEKILIYIDLSQIMQDKNILKLYDEYDQIKEKQKIMKY